MSNHKTYAFTVIFKAFLISSSLIMTLGVKSNTSKTAVCIFSSVIMPVPKVFK